MSAARPPIEEIVGAWTEAERDVWKAWSGVDQDVSRGDSQHGCGEVLDALEASVQELARVQSTVVRSACDGLQANPFLPSEAQALVAQACRPLLSLTSWQPHLVSAWFGMARHVAISL